MPTSDIFTGIDNQDLDQMQQDAKSRESDIMSNNPKQFTNPDSIEQPGAPKGLYGTVNPGEDINVDKSSPSYNAQLYNSILGKVQTQYPGNQKLPDIDLPQSETDRFTGNKYGFDITRNNESFYADQQGFLKMGFNAGANLVNKTAAYVLQNTGFILGAPFAALTQNISAMTDNFLVKAGDAIKAGVEKDFPIYKSDKYQNGNIFQKLGTLGWWTDDATDRLALTAAMFVPGIAETKGIGLFGSVTDEAGNMRAVGMGAKAIASMGENPQNYPFIGKTFLSNLYKAATDGVADVGVSPALKSYVKGLGTAELYTWNIIGQSALNAKETQEAVYKATGDKEKAGSAGMKSFWETVPLSLLGSLAEIPQMFSTTQGAKSVLKKLFDGETGELIPGALEAQSPSLGKTIRNSLLTGLEHGQNESMQVAVSRYNEDSAEGKDTRGTLPGVFGDFMDNINDPNGQNNIALGTIQGILMTLGGRGLDIYNKKDQREAAERLDVYNMINQAKLARRYFNGDFAERDGDGSVRLDGNDNVINNPQKMADAGLSTLGIDQALAYRKKALEEGRFVDADYVNYKNLANYAYNFLNDPKGLEYFSNILKVEAATNEKNPDRVNDVDINGIEMTPQRQLQQHLADINIFKKIYQALDQRHAGFTQLEFDRKDKGEVRQAAKFLDDLKATQYNEAIDQEFLAARLEGNDRELSRLDVDTKAIGLSEARHGLTEDEEFSNEGLIKEPSNPMEERYNQILKENKQLRPALEDSKQRYKALVDKKAQKEAFNKEKALAKKVKETAAENTEQQQTANAQKQLPLNTSNIPEVEQVQPETTTSNDQTQTNQTQAPQTTQQGAAPVQAESTPQTPVDEKAQKSKDLFTQYQTDLANAKSPEEKSALQQKYIKDSQALNTTTTQTTPTTEAFDKIKALVPTGKNIHRDEHTAVNTLINQEVKKGSISPEQETQLYDLLNSKNITGTPFNTEQEAEEEGADKVIAGAETPEEPVATDVDQTDQIPNEEAPTENNEDIVQGGDYDPTSAEVKEALLDNPSYSALAYNTSNKTVTQEEGTNENGNFNNTLDEDPYKQFIQGYLRVLNQEGIPTGGLHGKIVKDSDDLPHSEDTKKYLSDSEDSLEKSNPNTDIYKWTNQVGRNKTINGKDWGDATKQYSEGPLVKIKATILKLTGLNYDSRDGTNWSHAQSEQVGLAFAKTAWGDKRGTIEVYTNGNTKVVLEGKTYWFDKDGNQINQAQTSSKYGSVLVLTDSDRNILYFDENYSASPERSEGAKPIAFSFTSEYWDSLKNARAQLGEERTGISAAEFEAQYNREKEQQKLARELTEKGKEVKVEIKGVTNGVTRKSQFPMKASTIITPNMNAFLTIPSSIDKYDPSNPGATKFVLVGNRALVNGGLYAETRDSKTGVISHVRLIPNLLSDMPELLDNIRDLMNHSYDNKNEANIVRDHLKKLLFLGTRAGRPALVITENDSFDEYNIRMMQDGIMIDPEAAFSFIIQQRLNISKANVDNDQYNEITIEGGKPKVETKDGYKDYLLENSTTVDLPIITSEGNKFIPLNSYAHFDFPESPETMRQRLNDKKVDSKVPTKEDFKPNETSIFRHGQNREDVTGKNSGKNNIPLDAEGKKYASQLGTLMKSMGIKKIISSPIARAVETAKIAALKAGIKDIESNELLKTWDIGDFTSQPNDQFDEAWFVNHPNDIEKDGRKLGESFNQFVERMQKAYDFVRQNTDDQTSIIAHSRDIRVWTAMKENNGIWNDNAVERYLNKEDGFDFTSIERPPVVADNSSLTKQPLRRLGTAQSQDVSKLAKDQDQKDKENLEGLKAGEDTRENRPLLENSEVSWVNKTFGAEVAQRVNDAINSDARALWTTSGIKLYRDARKGDGYHEAWHHFSQLYLSQAEKRSLYDEARKKNVKFTTRDGRKLNSKQASDFDLEEFIADDFRDYAESDGKSRLVDRPYRNNIFRKILDFLKKFFFGDINVSKLYDDLYKANLNHYSPSINNAMWGKLNSKALDKNGNEIVDNQKAAYYRDLVDYHIGDQLLAGKTSIEAMRKNPTLASAIYQNIYNDLVNKYYNPMLDKADKGENINQEVAEDLFNILTNWQSFVDYHKLASKLFLNIQRELVVDVPENPEDVSIDTEPGSEDYEIKEEDSEAFGDDEVDKDIVQSDKLYDVAGNEKSSIQAASIQTRGLVRMLPSVDFDNGKFTIQVDANGFPRLNDYARTWNNIAYELSNLDKYEEMLQKLQKPDVMKKIPEISVLLKHLPDPGKDMSPAEVNTMTAFRTDFNRAYIGIYSGKMYPDKGYQLNEETKRNVDQVKKGWTANFFNKTAGDPDVASGAVLVDEETGKNYLNPGTILTYNMGTVQGKDTFMRLIGINFSDSAKKNRFYLTGLPKLLSDIQNNINLRQKNGFKIYNPMFDVRGDIRDPESKEIIIPGLAGTTNGLANFQSKYAEDVPSLSYQTAEGEMIYGLSLNHTISIIANTLNKASSYDDIKNNPAMQHLNWDNNPYVRGSIFLNGMFTNSGKRLSYNSIIVGNYNGLKTQDKDGNTTGQSTTNLNVRQKAIFDMNSLLSKGVVEVMRTESSKSAYFIKLAYYQRPDSEGRPVGADPSATYLPISFSELPAGFESPRLMSYMIDYYLRDELNRMKTAESVEVYKSDPKLMQAAKSFDLFRKILRNPGPTNTEALKDAIKADLENKSVNDIIQKHRTKIEAAIINFFNKELESFKETLDEENITAADINSKLNTKSYEQQLRAFIANSFLLNVEYTKLFNGDTIYQAHYKDYFKRSKGDISTGKTPITDDAFVRHMRSIEGNTFSAFIGSEIPNNYKTFRTLNFRDDVRDSKYIDIYKKNLKDLGVSDEDANKWTEKYKGMKIADGQGYITLDFYRQFLKSIGNWSDAQEMGYKVELAKYRLANKDFNTEYTNEMKERDREFLKANPQNFSFYPPLKVQYNGPIQATGTFAPVMDKFSVVPIIPSIVQGTPLEKIHNEMLKSGIGYAKYVSGTKKYVQTPISLYNENGFSGIDLSKHEPATHYLEYLKEQINTNPKIKTESIFGSQIRKLIEANIFSSGQAGKIDIERHERYKSYIKGIRELGRKELFNDIGLTEIDGKTRIGDMTKFISTIQEQADLRELNDNVKDYIQLDKDTGQLKYRLETSLNRRPIQDLLMGLIDRKLRVQKLSGDQLIQISSSGYQANDFKYTNPTEEEIKKYGTNGLRFYHLEYDENGKPKSIVTAQVKVALIGSFSKLLFKAHPDGKKIGNIERLNDLLKDENWVKENQKSINLIGYRIPTQGHNSMENLQVAEFLPPHAGSVVIVPAEIVSKSGSDFDIDKLSIFRPSFDENGELIKDGSKEGYSNKIIDLFSEILSDPKNFKSLIRPNDTDIVKPEVNDVAVAIGKRSAADAKDSKPYQGTEIYRYKSNLRKFETLLSAKKLLSIFAVNNTFTTVMQQAGIKQNMTYGINAVQRNVKMLLMSPQERTQVVKDGKLDIGRSTAVNGDLKQDYYSQLINATVDAASDDFFGYVNMSYENVNVLSHLMNQGVPFDRAIWFLNQPVLLRYYADMRKKEKGQSKDGVKAAILGQLVGKDFFKTLQNGNIVLDKVAYNKELNLILNNPKYQNTYLSKDTLKKYTKKTRDVDSFLEQPGAKGYNALVFSYFISLQEQAGLFRDFQKVSSYDTTKISSPTVVYGLLATMKQIELNRLFDKGEVAKIADKSVIGAFDNKRLVAIIGNQMMPVAFNPYFMDKSVQTIMDNTQYKTRAVQKKFINNYETQWVEYVVKTLGAIDGKSMVSYSKYLQEGKNNMARRFNTLVDKFPDLKKDYALVNRIRPNVSNNANIKKSNIEVYRLFENTTDDQNRYISEFRNLINSDQKKYSPAQNKEIQKFFKDLAILGFIQSGFTKSNISFQDIVPYEEFADIFKTAADNFISRLASDKPLLGTYIQEFQNQFNSNQKSSQQSWRGRDYFLSEPIYKELKKKSTDIEEKKSQINTKPSPQPYENTVKPKYSDDIKSVSIQIQPDNIQKILKGQKVTTTRSESQVKQIGLEPGDFGEVNFGGKQFLVRYRGMQTIAEAGGKDAMIKSEGVTNENDFKYQQTKDWVNGKGKLGVYEIIDQNKTIRELRQESLLQPEVKTQRQYWPGYEIHDSYKDEIAKALGKAGFKHAMDNLSTGEYYFVDAPLDSKLEDFEDEDFKDDNEKVLTRENFDRAVEIDKKFVGNDEWNIFSNKDGDAFNLHDLSNELSKVELDDDEYNTMKIPSLDELLNLYSRDEIPDNFKESAEAKLAEYGLLKYVGYNPNQLRLFNDDEYKKMLEDCKGGK